MRPSDLKCPFSWNDRKPCIHDHIFYLPAYYSDYQSFKIGAFESLFGNSNEVQIEYCSGNGAWIFEKARAFPEYNWIAVEKRFDRARKIWSKIKNHNLTNLFIVQGEGHLFTKHYLPAATVGNVFINFPDPWPKTKHAKNRLIKPTFIAQMARILKEQGTFTFVTDDASYASLTIDLLLKNPLLRSLHPEMHYTHHLDNYGTSFFDELWRQKGKKIHFIQFAKQ